jgi:cell division protein FtsB
VSSIKSTAVTVTSGSAIGRIVSAQREELEREIVGLQDEAERVAEEARELAGEVPI